MLIYKDTCSYVLKKCSILITITTYILLFIILKVGIKCIQSNYCDTQFLEASLKWHTINDIFNRFHGLLGLN